MGDWQAHPHMKLVNFYLRMNVQSKNSGSENRLPPTSGFERTDFLSSLRLWELKFDHILGLRVELLNALKCKFPKHCDFRQMLGLVELKYCEMVGG